MAWFARRRVRRTTEGVEVRLDGDERRLVHELLGQLRDLLLAEPDERTRRLFPTAYPDDPEADAEYQRLMREDLVATRLTAIEQVEASLEGASLDDAGLNAMVTSINAVRLVIGTLLDVSEDLDRSDLPYDEAGLQLFACYEYLSVLLEELVEVALP